MAGASSLRLLAKCFISILTLSWFLMWMFRPTKYWSPKFWTPLVTQVYSKPASKPFVSNGAAYVLVYVLPVIVVAVLGAVVHHPSKRERQIKIKKERFLKSFRQSPWTYPLLIRGPLSILSAAEFIFLVIFIAYVVYYVVIASSVSFSTINHKKVHGADLLHKKMEIIGTKLGLAVVPCLLLLFFPVTRGSAILQLINLPFEHAVKFHIWIATTMLVTSTLHGLVYIVAWIAEKEIQELWAWDATEISGLSGVLALVCGLVIWITSLPFVRKNKFQLFYYTHHLYVVFVLLFALHVGDALFSCIIGALLLFFASRLLRYLQSHEKVDVISVRMLSSESMELTIAKHPDLSYNTASFVFLNIPAVSVLQWHPFTVTSSSNVDTDHLSLYIKCSGDWTSKLQKLIQEHKSENSLQLEAAVEGPYGHNMDYLNRYQVITFIAGGSGISPFISMLKDLLHSIQEKLIEPPKKILLIYIVKTCDQLCILESITPAAICPDFIETLSLEIEAYVTRQDGPDPEQNTSYENVSFQQVEMKRLPSMKGPSSAIFAEPSPTSLASFYFSRRVKAMSTSLTSHGLVQATVLIASFAGYLILAAIIGRYYIYPIVSNPHRTFTRSGKGFLAFLETLLGVLVFGGASALISQTFFRKTCQWTPQAPPMKDRTLPALKPTQITYGRRPDFPAIFMEQAKLAVKCNVGVFSCGPRQMQTDIAALCQQNRVTMEIGTYNYHPLSFSF